MPINMWEGEWWLAMCLWHFLGFPTAGEGKKCVRGALGAVGIYLFKNGQAQLHCSKNYNYNLRVFIYLFILFCCIFCRYWDWGQELGRKLGMTLYPVRMGGAGDHTPHV